MTSQDRHPIIGKRGLMKGIVAGFGSLLGIGIVSHAVFGPSDSSSDREQVATKGETPDRSDWSAEEVAAAREFEAQWEDDITVIDVEL